jgi:hypothetical protein
MLFLEPQTMAQTYGITGRIKTIARLATVILFFFGCKEEISPVSPIPDVVVQEQVNLNSVTTQELKLGDGRFIYISGGISGIILYRKSTDIYLAFERKSPYRMEDTCGRITVPSSRFYMEDTCHQCTFGWDGRPQSGPCRDILKQYKVQFISSNTLSITNP